MNHSVNMFLVSSNLQISRTRLTGWSLERIFSRASFLIIMLQIFSITLRSREYDGHFSTFTTLACRNVIVWAANWQGALSCWNTKWLLIGWLSKKLSDFLPKLAHTLSHSSYHELVARTEDLYYELPPPQKNIIHCRNGGCWIRIDSSGEWRTYLGFGTLILKYVSSENMTDM
jgi:hypothetical protein